MADNFYQRLISECVDEMMRIAHEAEVNVYDYIVPALFEKEAPADREAFYVEGSPDSPLFAQGFDWGVLKDVSPHLWQKYSGDALNIQQNQVKAQSPAEALDLSREAQSAAGQQFQRQVQPPNVFGLHTGRRMTTSSLGLDSGFSVPMGRFGSG